MKLEFESNPVSSPLVGNQVPSEFEERQDSPEILETLREGIKAAQEGNRAVARNLLLKVTEADPKNENAWLWLASISEYPEELLVFLNNVLQINPENERALEWSAATRSLIAKTFVQRGIEAAKEDQKDFAKQCFLQAIVHDSKSELAWLWLASVSDAPEEKMSHLQKVLSINPENENALTSLKNAREHEAKSLLPKANTAAISGKRDEAQALLEQIFADAPEFEDAWMLKAHISESFEDKLAAFEKVLQINPENPVAKANIDSLQMFAGNQDLEAEASMPFGETQSFDAPAVDDSGYSSQEFETADEQSDEEDDSSEDASGYSFESGVADEEVNYHEDEAVPYEETVTGEDWNSSDEAFGADSADQSSESQDPEPELEMVPEEESVHSEDGNFEEAPVTDSEDDGSDAAVFEAGSDSDSEEDQNHSLPEAAEDVDHDYLADHVDTGDAGQQNEEFESDDAVSVDADVDSESVEDEETFVSAEEGLAEDVSEEVAQEEHSSDYDEEDSLEMNSEAGEESIETEHAEADYSDDYSEADVEEPASADSSEPEMPSFESTGAFTPEFPHEKEASQRPCPFCHESNENQAFACHGCKAIFTVSDIDMILSHSKADREVISAALQRMESEKLLRGVEFEELKFMGIGYLNLKDYRKGFEYLKEAAKRDENDVVLRSQIDALAVRIVEIEQHERDQERMPEGKRILIVDDSPTVRKLISGKLEKCGHEAICAVDGMDALAKINEVIPDLILLDITMPRMDGYQVCKLIRGNDATKDVPVVMISGKDGFFDKVRGRMAGTSHYITKPFGPETLMKAVKEYIQ